MLRRLLRRSNVDVFCCNTVPSRYRALGIDYETLSAAKPDLIWAGISAIGPEYPDVPGYDPVIQAMCGYMELTGDPNGPPMLTGVPVIDLKAGDEVYANVMLALLERAETGRGRRIDVSMLQAAASWLITSLPLVDFDCQPNEITRAGNEHRKFIPDQRVPARTASSTWRSAATCSGSGSPRSRDSHPSRTRSARRTRGATGSAPRSTPTSRR